MSGIPKGTEVRVAVGQEVGGVAFYSIAAEFQKSSVDKRFSEFEQLRLDLINAGVAAGSALPKVRVCATSAAAATTSDTCHSF
jgi:hypothetical protein